MSVRPFPSAHRVGVGQCSLADCGLVLSAAAPENQNIDGCGALSLRACCLGLVCTSDLVPEQDSKYRHSVGGMIRLTYFPL